MFSGDGKKKLVTITEIARQAGVTAQTVSYVLSNNPNVKISEGTRRLVNRIAKDMGYRPNRLAQAMKSGRMQMIGMWIPLSGRHSRASIRFLSAFHKIAKDGEHDTLVLDITSDSGEALSTPPSMGWPVDGVVGFDCLNAFQVALDANAMPRAGILIGPSNPIVDSVCWDLEQGYRRLTESLLAKGAKRIGFLGSIKSAYFADTARVKGIESAVAGKNIDLILMESGDHRDQLCSTLRPHLKGSNSLDAIITCCDSGAMGAMREIAVSGHTLGQDIHIGTYGDSAESEFMPAGVTCLRIPFEQVASLVWDRLKLRMEGYEGPAIHQDVLMETADNREPVKA